MKYTGENTRVIIRDRVAQLRSENNGQVLATFDIESGKFERDDMLIGETGAWKLMLYNLIFEQVSALTWPDNLRDLNEAVEHSPINKRGFG